MLQLGIRNIFDAYLANLCEMSSEPNLYVRSVEQVITISVQKYYTFHKCEYSIIFRTFWDELNSRIPGILKVPGHIIQEMSIIIIIASVSWVSHYFIVLLIQ